MGTRRGPNRDEPAPAQATVPAAVPNACLLYTSDAADERSSVDLGGRRIIKKTKKLKTVRETDVDK